MGPQPAREDRPRPAALRVLRAVASADGPLTISDLTTQLGGHPNTTRQQIDHLVETGFAHEVALPATGRGRPARGYLATVSGRQVAFEDPDRDEHSALVAAVAEFLAATPEPHAASHALGTTWGRNLAAAHRGTLDLMTALAAQGFTPEPTATGIALRTCPLLSAARAHPEVICTMHQGLIDTLATEPLRLVPFAEPGACLVLRS